MMEFTRPDPFAAPIPGESLTQTPGSSPWEHPPQFADVREAAEHIFDQLSRTSDRVALMLKAGITAEAIARSALFAGFAKGKISVDVALLLAPIVLMQVVAIGKLAGVGRIKTLNERAEVDQFRAAMISAIPEEERSFKLPEKKTEKKTDKKVKLKGLLADG